VRQPIDPSSSFRQLATALAGMPVVVAALLRAHAPDGFGRCRACGMPGTGTPYIPAPCPLRTLAETARTIHARSGDR
jgi:hypothetical protein